MSRIQQTLGTSATATVIHTAEDAKTLIRTNLRLKAYITGDIATPVRGELVLAVRPNNQSVVDEAATTQSLDQDVPLQEIARLPFVATHNATGDYVQVDNVEMDTKAMRTMKPGDAIEVRAIASTASSILLFGIIYQWFKE